MGEAYACCSRHVAVYVPGAAKVAAYAYALMREDDQIFTVFYRETEYGGLVRWRLTAASPLHEVQFHEPPEGLPN